MTENKHLPAPINDPYETNWGEKDKEVVGSRRALIQEGGDQKRQQGGYGKQEYFKKIIYIQI